jgi:hypothetical protein
VGDRRAPGLLAALWVLPEGTSELLSEQWWQDRSTGEALRFVDFHNRRHPRELGANHLAAVLDGFRHVFT